MFVTAVKQMSQNLSFGMAGAGTVQPARLAASSPSFLPLTFPSSSFFFPLHSLSTFAFLYILVSRIWSFLYYLLTMTKLSICPMQHKETVSCMLTNVRKSMKHTTYTSRMDKTGTCFRTKYKCLHSIFKIVYEGISYTYKKDTNTKKRKCWCVSLRWYPAWTFPWSVAKGKINVAIGRIQQNL